MADDTSGFENRADAALQGFMEAIEEALGDYLEVDLDGGILSIELESGGQYVINKHAPMRQIWLSSPLSGAAHFNYDENTGAWVCTRGGDNLTDVLGRELSAATGQSLSLK